MILRPEVSPCKVRVFRALHVALREIVKKKKEFKKTQTETVTVGCPLQPSIFGDFYSEIYTHRYISMKFNWK